MRQEAHNACVKVITDVSHGSETIGGAQRRRPAEDELNMRDIFAEDDLIAAEIQSIYQVSKLYACQCPVIR